MKTYRVKVGGDSFTRGHSMNTHYITVVAENANEAKRIAIRELKLEGINMPGKTYEDNMRWSNAQEIR